MKRYRWYVTVCAGIALVLLAAAFFWYYDTEEDGKRHIIYIAKVVDEDNDFWTQLIEGVEMAAGENNLEVTIVAADSEEDYERQNELIAWAVAQNPSVIILTPISYTETSQAAAKVRAAGIPLVLIDSVMDVDIADAVIATDNIKLGEVEGSFMKQFATPDSRIAIIGHVRNSSTAMEREYGVRKGLGAYEEQIVDVVFCDSDYDKAYELMAELIEKYPDIDLVAGLNEYSAVGAARAIKDMHLEDKIKVAGIDSSLEEIQLLEEGIFEGIVIQRPFKMGYMGVEAASRILNGENVLKNIDSGCELITKNNLYTEENQKLLFRFRDE